MDIHERLALFYRRLEAAPPAATAEEAMQLVSRLIEQVEDEFCPLPREKVPPMKFTGRMYAPQPDRTRLLPPGGLVADARYHRIICYADGAIEIMRMPNGTIELTKAGKKP